MLHLFHTHVSSVLFGCCICFTHMFQVFYLDVAYVSHMFQVFYLDVAYVSHTCFKCFIWILHMYHTSCKCFIWMLHMFHTYVATVCFIYVRRMLHSSVSCCKFFTGARWVMGARPRHRKMGRNRARDRQTEAHQARGRLASLVHTEREEGSERRSRAGCMHGRPSERKEWHAHVANGPHGCGHLGGHVKSRHGQGVRSVGVHPSGTWIRLGPRYPSDTSISGRTTRCEQFRITMNNYRWRLHTLLAYGVCPFDCVFGIGTHYLVVYQKNRYKSRGSLQCLEKKGNSSSI
jgi:hypothetical protein